MSRLVTSVSQALSIMAPENRLSSEAVGDAFRVRYLEEHQKKLELVGFREEVLDAAKDTHALVAGFPLSINDMHAKVPSRSNKLFYSPAGTGWHNKEDFAAMSVECRWFLLRKEPIANSMGKWYEDQLRLLPEGEENPWARDVTFATMALFLSTGERLFSHVCVRCKDVTFRDRRVFVGNFNSNGFEINSWFDDPSRHIAVASLRNS